MQETKTWEEEKRLIIIKSLMLGECENIDEAWAELGWKNEPMVVVCIEQFKKQSLERESLGKLLSYVNANSDEIYSFDINGREVLILKGKGTLDKLNSLIYHYKLYRPQGNSPLGLFFITYGQIAKTPAALCESYHIAEKLMNDRFYYRRDEHICGPDRIVDNVESTEQLKDTSELALELASLLQAKNKLQINDFIRNLEDSLLRVRPDPDIAKTYIFSIYIKMNLELQTDFEKKRSILNNENFDKLRAASSLFDMMDIISSEFSDVMQQLGGRSTDGVINDVFYYVEHNYQTDLKLEKIAYKFGYNSAYLGRIFKASTGKSFSSYVEKIRMEKACELLERGYLKVYEVAEKVGYSNVDYFHIKFQKYMGMSPAEYKKRASRQ